MEVSGRRRGTDAWPARSLSILMVTPRFHPDVGGVERHVYEVSRRLVDAGCDVTVLCTDRAGDRPRSEIRDGVEVRRVRAWPRRRDYYFAPQLWREMARGTWDVVHVQSYHTLVAPIAMLRARSLHIPFVLTFHGGGHSSRVRHSMRGAQRRVLRPLIRHAARLIVLAQFEIDLYARELATKPEGFVRIPNGTTGIGERPDRAPDMVRDPIVTSVGRLERYKGHHRVIDAMPYVIADVPDAKLRIVGRGPEEARLRARAGRLGIAERVEFRTVAGDDAATMGQLLCETSVFATLSEFETHPLAVLEAAAAGCAMIVADSTGLSELVEKGVATPVRPDASPEMIARAIVRELEMGPRSYDLVLPTWDDCAASLLELYREVACVS